MPKRIVSLLPAATELVFSLGAGSQLVGRSHECDFPAEAARLPVCTRSRLPAGASSGEIDRQVKGLAAQALSLYEVDTELLRTLRPDVILTQTQCQVCAVSEADLRVALGSITGLTPEIVSLSPRRVADIWSEFHKVAAALDLTVQAREWMRPLKVRVVDILEKTCAVTNRPNVACLEWLDPVMSAGHWTPELVEFAGGRCLFSEAGKPSATLGWEDLLRRDPALIVVMACGFDVARTRQEMKALTQRPGWNGLKAVQNGKVFLTDGNAYFNRPGPRLVESLEILAEIISPALFPRKSEAKAWEQWAGK